MLSPITLKAAPTENYSPSLGSGCLPCHVIKASVRKVLTLGLEYLRSAVKPDNGVIFEERPYPNVSRLCTNCAAHRAMLKMWKNQNKAVKEHLQKEKEQPYIQLSQMLSFEALTQKVPVQPLQLSYVSASKQGPRPSMEDCHFFKEIEQGTIAGVFDGHGGKAVAEFANSLFQEQFAAVLDTCKGNVYQAFNEILDKIQTNLINDGTFKGLGGSTAVLCFIDKTSNLIYTATLGDSEANIYRTDADGQMVSIPLSCVRDWTSNRDAQRAAIALDIPEIANVWPTISNPKQLRFPHPFFGLNVSRALGDIPYVGTPEKPGLIHKAKITVHFLLPGDNLILACDGLKDYTLENELIELIQSHQPDQNLAEIMVNHALDKKNAYDNVTVLAIHAKKTLN